MGARELGAYIRQLREDRGLTQEELGAASFLSHAYVSKIERGRLGSVGYDALRNLASALGQSLSELEALYRDEPRPRLRAPVVELPREIAIVADLSAGYAGGMVVDSYEYVPLSEMRGKMLRGGRVTGTCMAPLIEPGDIVIFNAYADPRDGQIVVAVIPDPTSERGRGVIKQFYRMNGNIKLAPKVGEPIILPADDVRIEGVVVEVRKKLA